MIDSGSRQARVARAFEYGVVALAAIAFAASYGLTYGYDNQLVYFLKSLTLTDKSLLRSDWFTYHTTQYHRVFIYLGAFLLKLNAHGWAVAITPISAGAAGRPGHLPNREARGGRSARGRSLFAAALDPVHHAHLQRGHELLVRHHFAALHPGRAGLDRRHAVLRRGALVRVRPVFGHRRRVSRQLLGAGLSDLRLGALGARLQRSEAAFDAAVFSAARDYAGALALLLAASHTKASPEAQEILFRVRSPHHYNPARFERNFMPFAAWQLLGIGSGWLLHKTRQWPAFGRGLVRVDADDLDRHHPDHVLRLPQSESDLRLALRAECRSAVADLVRLRAWRRHWPNRRSRVTTRASRSAWSPLAWARSACSGAARTTRRSRT